jgi:hypothetical protein
VVVLIPAFALDVPQADANAGIGPLAIDDQRAEVKQQRKH